MMAERYLRVAAVAERVGCCVRNVGAVWGGGVYISPASVSDSAHSDE